MYKCSFKCPVDTCPCLSPTSSLDMGACTRADKCLPAVLVDLAISAGIESTLPVRPACRMRLHYTAASQLRASSRACQPLTTYWRQPSESCCLGMMQGGHFGMLLPHRQVVALRCPQVQCPDDVTPMRFTGTAQAKLVKGTVRRTTEWKACVVGRPALEGPVRLAAVLVPVQCCSRAFGKPSYSHCVAACLAPFCTGAACGLALFNKRQEQCR